MRRRKFIAIVGGSVIALTGFARAQQHTRRIGIPWHGANEEEEEIYLRAVRQGMSDFGYVEGKNIVLENRFPEEIPDRFTSLAADLAALHVDILVA